MHQQIAITLFGLASTAVAIYSPEQLNSLRALNSHNIAVRQDQDDTDNDGDDAIETGACISSAQSIIAEVPSVTGALSTYLDNYYSTAVITETAVLCTQTPDVPSSLSSSYSSYDQAASSWYADNSDDIEELATVCATETGELATQLTIALDYLTAVSAMCASFSATATPTSSMGSSKTSSESEATATSTDSGSDATSSSTPDTAAAVRPTGVIVGAVAAAGILGAAIAL
ncbi:hypothetical protein F5Y15DRAFT_122330 [Xylariaceae sp. FL0016]|nr:hypothetical protein F5Y15DRAFT_122330 [Xylariaceae sp. FL0016]